MHDARIPWAEMVRVFVPDTGIEVGNSRKVSLDRRENLVEIVAIVERPRLKVPVCARMVPVAARVCTSFVLRLGGISGEHICDVTPTWTREPVMNKQLDLQTTYRAILDAARERRFVSYGDLAKANGAAWSEVRFDLYGQLGHLMELASERGWPIPSSIVVNQRDVATGTLDGSAREGFIGAAKELGFDIQDVDAFVEAQQQKMFEWAPDAPDKLDVPEKPPGRGPGTSGPQFVQYFGPILDALRALGGAADPRSVMDKVIELVAVTERDLGEKTKSGQSRYENQVGWARFYLCRAGLIDGKVRGTWVLTDEGIATHLDRKGAMALFRDVRSRFDDTSGNDETPAPDPLKYASAELFNDPERSFWFVGASWGGVDQTERFLRDGIWTNGYDDDRSKDRVQRIKPGDLIAIKSVFTQNSHDRRVSLTPPTM